MKMEQNQIIKLEVNRQARGAFTRRWRGAMPLAAGACLLGGLGAAQATVLNFDDQPGGRIEVNYGGVVWNDSWFVVGDSTYYPVNSQPAGITSYDNMNGQSWTGMSYVDFTTPTVFNGAYFSGYYTAGFDLYAGGNLVASSADVNLGPVSVYVPSQYDLPVDRVMIRGAQSYFTMDDFTFGEAVPEPSSLILLGIGAAGLLWRRRRAGE